jgi:hypothetical protein
MSGRGVFVGRMPYHCCNSVCGGSSNDARQPPTFDLLIKGPSSWDNGDTATMICERCGSEAPTKRVNFYRNIGAIVIRFPQSTECNLCKRCVHEVFWKYTLINATLGWWGMRSVVLTPIYIVSNTIQYILCLGMRTASPPTTPLDFAAPPNSNTDQETASAATTTPVPSRATKGQIVQCPHCNIRVCVTADGACPSCRKPIREA